MLNVDDDSETVELIKTLVVEPENVVVAAFNVIIADALTSVTPVLVIQVVAIVIVARSNWN
jgi:hypothetical protein